MRKWSYEATLVILLMLGFGLSFMDRANTAIMMPLIVEEFHPTYGEAGLAISIVGFTWGTFIFLGGFLSDRWGRKRTLVPAIGVFSLMQLVMGLTSNIRQMIFLRGFMGGGEGQYLASCNPWIVEESKPTRRGLNIGIVYLGATLFGSALVPLISTNIATIAGSWRAPFFWLAAPGFVLAAIIWFLTREPPSIVEKRRLKTETKPVTPVKMVEVLKHRNIILSVVLGIMYIPLHLCYLYFAPMYMTDVRGWDILTVGQVMMMLGLGGSIGMVGGGRISDIIGRRLTCVISFALSSLAGYAFFFHATTPLLGMITTFILGLTIFPIATCVFGTIPPEAVGFARGGFAVGIANGFAEIAGGGGIMSSVGFLADVYGLQVVGIVLIVCAIIGFGVSFGLKETAPRILAKQKLIV